MEGLSEKEQWNGEKIDFVMKCKFDMECFCVCTCVRVCARLTENVLLQNTKRSGVYLVLMARALHSHN